MKEALKTRIRTAALLSLSVVLSLVLAFWWNLERPFWAGFTAMAISLTTVGQSFQKALLRVGGTVVGALTTLGIMALVWQEHLLFLCLLFCFLCSMAVQTLRSRYRSYLYYTGALTATVISIGSIGSDMPPFLFALARLEETGLGILVYSLLALLWSGHPVVGDLYAGVDKFLAAYVTFFDSWVPSWTQRQLLVPMKCHGETEEAEHVSGRVLSSGALRAALPRTESAVTDDVAHSLACYMNAMALLDKAQELLPAARLENYAVRRRVSQWETFFRDSRECLQSMHSLIMLERKLSEVCLVRLLPNLPDAWAGLQRSFAALAETASSPDAVMPERLPRLQLERSQLQRAGQLLRHRVIRFVQEWERQREACLLLSRSRHFLLEEGEGEVRVSGASGTSAAQRQCSWGKGVCAWWRGIRSRVRHLVEPSAVPQAPVISGDPEKALAEKKGAAGRQFRHKQHIDAGQALFTVKQRAFLLRCTTVYWGAVVLWVYINPPGTLHATFVEMSIVIGLVGLLSGDLPPVQVMTSFAKGCCVAFVLYFGLIPLLHSILPLVLVLLLYFFGIGWWYYLPADGLRRNGMLIPVLVLGGLRNDHLYAPESFFSGVLSMMLCAALVALVYYLFSGAGLPHRFVMRQRRLLRGVLALLEGQRTGTAAGRWWRRWRGYVLQELAQAQLELAFQLDDRVSHELLAPLKLTALNTCALLRHMAVNEEMAGGTGLALLPGAAGTPESEVYGTEAAGRARSWWSALWKMRGRNGVYVRRWWGEFWSAQQELRPELDKLREWAVMLEACLPRFPATRRRLVLLEILQSLHTLLDSATTVDWHRVNQQRW